MLCYAQTSVGLLAAVAHDVDLEERGRLLESVHVALTPGTRIGSCEVSIEEVKALVATN
jgi:hypothetical protein